MPYYGHIYYGYGDFLANNLYVLLLIPVLLLSLWAQFQVSGSFRRYNAISLPAACITSSITISIKRIRFSNEPPYSSLR